MPLKDMEDRVLLILRGQFQGRTRSKAVVEQGFFIGDTFPIDRNGWIRNKALATKRRSETEARVTGLINNMGEVIDPRPTIKVFGKEVKNTGYNKPLKEEWNRRLYGIFKYHDAWEFGMMNLRGERAKNTIIEYYKPCKFMAMNKGLTNGYLTLNQSRFTEFQEIKTDWNTEQISQEVLKQNMIDLTTKSIEKEFNNTKDSWDAWTVLSGTVGEPIIQGRRNTVIFLTSSDPTVWVDEPLTCFIPAEWEIDFPEYAKVLAFGKLNEARRQSDDETEGTKIVLNVYGVLTYPGQAKLNRNVKELSSKEVKFAWKKI